MAGAPATLLAAAVAEPERAIGESRHPARRTERQQHPASSWNDTARADPAARRLPAAVRGAGRPGRRTPSPWCPRSEPDLRASSTRAPTGWPTSCARSASGPRPWSALCLERSPEHGRRRCSAVLKAGGAYLPLDPAYPAERLAFMLDDAARRLLLTHGALRSTAARARRAPACGLDADWPAIAQQPATRAGARASTATTSAYVIYTSGSTGRPKGVVRRAPRPCQPPRCDGASTSASGRRTSGRAPPVLRVRRLGHARICWPLLGGARLVVARDAVPAIAGAALRSMLGRPA